MFIDQSFNDLLRLFQLLMIEDKKLFHLNNNIVCFSSFKTFTSSFVVSCIWIETHSWVKTLNHVTQSFTKVDADHLNDVHLSHDVFYLNRSTISSSEVSFSYSTSKTATQLLIHFWADLSVNLKSFAIALFHLIWAFAFRFFSRFDAWTRFFRFFFISAVILFLVCRTIITLLFWATDSLSLFLLTFTLLWLWVASISHSIKASELAFTKDLFMYQSTFSRSFFDIL